MRYKIVITYKPRRRRATANDYDIVSIIQDHFTGVLSRFLQNESKYAIAIVGVEHHPINPALNVVIQLERVDEDLFHKVCDRLGELDQIEFNMIGTFDRVAINYDLIYTANDFDNKSINDREVERNMTNREFWLKLFGENDVALIAAINSVQRSVPPEYKPLNDDQVKHILDKKKWLDEKVESSTVKEVFGHLESEVKSTFTIGATDVTFHCCGQKIVIDLETDTTYLHKIQSCPFCSNKIKYWRLRHE